VAAALDRARFGAAVLDLHPERLPAHLAVDRVRRWIQGQQVAGVAEALVITGRGRHSPQGYSTVRDAVGTALRRLVREGALTAVTAHTEGSFVVALAPVGARLDAAPRRRDPAPPPAPPVRRLEGLSNAVVEALEALAAERLDGLGVRHPTPAQVIAEMGHVYSRLVHAHGASETALAAAIARARAELQDGPDR
jgi:hypothetical protein